ncbi:hypothetical protein ACLK19_07030 [Escherichia coli]
MQDRCAFNRRSGNQIGASLTALSSACSTSRGVASRKAHNIFRFRRVNNVDISPAATGCSSIGKACSLQCTIEQGRRERGEPVFVSEIQPGRVVAPVTVNIRAAGEFPDAVIQFAFPVRQFFYSSDRIGDQFIQWQRGVGNTVNKRVLVPFSAGDAPDTPAAFHGYRP